MSKRQVLMVIGVLVAVFPFLGFSPEFKQIIVAICGIVVALIAYSLAPKVKPVKETDIPFSEHRSAVLTNEKEATSAADTRSFVGALSEEKPATSVNEQGSATSAGPQSSIPTITNQNPPEQK